MSEPVPCPCGSGLDYAQCCRLLHHGKPASSPEALMRSRYSAFVRDDGDYVRASWHPDTRPAELTLEGGDQWLGLEIVDAKQDGDAGQVHFRATHRDGDGFAVLDILDDADRQALPFPPGMEVIWRVNPNPEQPAMGWVDTIVGLPWLDGSPSVWVAGESGAVRAVRRYLTQERRIERGRLYASGYWQIGLTEDRHQLEKRKDKEALSRSTS